MGQPSISFFLSMDTSKKRFMTMFDQHTYLYVEDHEFSREAMKMIFPWPRSSIGLAISRVRMNGAVRLTSRT